MPLETLPICLLTICTSGGCTPYISMCTSGDCSFPQQYFFLIPIYTCLSILSSNQKAGAHYKMSQKLNSEKVKIPSLLF